LEPAHHRVQRLCIQGLVKGVLEVEVARISGRSRWRVEFADELGKLPLHEPQTSVDVKPQAGQLAPRGPDAARQALEVWNLAVIVLLDEVIAERAGGVVQRRPHAEAAA